MNAKQHFVSLFLIMAFVISFFDSAMAQASNDQCAGAIELSVGDGNCSPEPYSISGATSSGQTECGDAAFNDVWFEITVNTGNFTLSFGNADVAQFNFSLFDFCGGTQVYCQQAAPFNSYQIELSSSGTYKLRISWQNPVGVTVENIELCAWQLSCDIDVSVVPAHTTCGQDNGAAMAEVSGGNDDYTYLWSNGATTGDISGLAAGIYSVTVSDATGCSASASVEINDSESAAVTTIVTDASCGLDNGSVSAYASGESIDSYEWSNGGNTQTITDLQPGDYTVTVTYGNGCVVTATDIVAAIPFDAMELDFAKRDTVLTVKVTGGTKPYTYLWDTGETTETIPILKKGTTTYTVTVTDAAGCIIEGWIEFTVSTKEVNADFPVRVYPNPSNDKMTVLIPYTNTASELMIYDLQGKPVLQRSIQPLQKATLDISGFPQGNYLLQVRNSERISQTLIVRI